MMPIIMVDEGQSGGGKMWRSEVDRETEGDRGFGERRHGEVGVPASVLMDWLGEFAGRAGPAQVMPMLGETPGLT